MDRYVIRYSQTTKVHAIGDVPKKVAAAPQMIAPAPVVYQNSSPSEIVVVVVVVENVDHWPLTGYTLNYTGEFLSHTSHDWLKQSEKLFPNMSNTKSAACRISL